MSLEAGDEMTPGQQEALLHRLAAQQQPFLMLVTNQLAAIEKRFTSVDTQMQVMSRVLNRLEDHDLLSKMESLGNRVAALEQERYQRQGAVKAAEWLPKWVGWAVAGVVFITQWVVDHWKPPA